MFVLPRDFTASKGFTLSLGGYTLTAHSMSVFLLSVSFPYPQTLLASMDELDEFTLGGGLGGVITLPVGRVIKLEGIVNIRLSSSGPASAERKLAVLLRWGC